MQEFESESIMRTTLRRAAAAAYLSAAPEEPAVAAQSMNFDRVARRATEMLKTVRLATLCGRK